MSVISQQEGPRHGRHGPCPSQLQEQQQETQEENINEARKELDKKFHRKNCLYWRCSSTFHLNESSMDSSVYETPPLARRHSQGLRGSKLNSICLGEGEIDQSKPQLEYLSIFFQMI